MPAKLADVQTPLQPHQQRVLDKLRASGGVLAAHEMGSGKTLEAIAAADMLARERGLPLEGVMPASLVANFEKEIAKHGPSDLSDYRLRSYEKAVRDKDLDPNAFVVMDEAQRARNKGTQLSQHLVKQVQNAPARLLLSGTPSYNHPVDAARLLNIAAGKQVLPDDPAIFKHQFIGERMINPPWMARLRGMKPSAVPVLKNEQKIVDAAKGYVDVHRGGGAGFPDREDEDIDVPMTGKQHQIYRGLEGQLPWPLRIKIRYGLPLDKRESKDLNAFATGVRQVSNTPRPFDRHMSDADEDQHSPKIQRAVEELHKHLQADPNFRGVVYSNFLNAGLHPYDRALTQRNVPHAVFHGGLPQHERKDLVNRYNAGELKALLLSSAGGEGLDLKGTKLIQMLDPHFNASKTDQVIGRGIRYQSHAHLPENERKVKVQHFYATQPKSLLNRVGIGHPHGAIDRYLQGRSDEKSTLGGQMMGALQRASDLGPLTPPQGTGMKNPKQAALYAGTNSLPPPEDPDGSHDVGARLLGAAGLGALTVPMGRGALEDLVGAQRFHHGTDGASAVRIRHEGLRTDFGGTGAAQAAAKYNPDFEANSHGKIHVSTDRQRAKGYADWVRHKDPQHRTDVVSGVMPFEHFQQHFQVDPDAGHGAFRTSTNVDPSHFTPGNPGLRDIWKGRAKDLQGYWKAHPERVRNGLLLGGLTAAAGYGAYRLAKPVLHKTLNHFQGNPEDAKQAALADVARLYGVKEATLGSALGGAAVGGLIGGGASAASQKPGERDWKKVLMSGAAGAGAGGLAGHLHGNAAARKGTELYSKGLGEGAQHATDALLASIKKALR